MDHAIGPSMDFWVALRTALCSTNVETFTVGEATDTPDCLRRYRQRLDAILDFPLAQALRRTFALRDWDLDAFNGFLNTYEPYMQEGPGRVSFLDNHDMNRFLFLAGGETQWLKLAALCQFTLAPAPTIYYGTEIGLSQTHDLSERGFGGDAQARQNMPWTEERWDHDLLSFYSDLTRLRRDHEVLVDGPRQTLHLDAASATYAYVRGTVEPVSSGLLIVFNLGDLERSLTFPALTGGQGPRILLSAGEPPRLGASVGVNISVAPRSGAVIDLGSVTEGR
jgi:glycosidase